MAVRRLADNQGAGERDARENGSDEREEQQDRRQRHPSLRGEEQREAPAGHCDRGRSKEGRTVMIDRRPGVLADPLADPADGNQQDDCSDGYEDVVEPGDQPELLFIDCGRRTLSLDEIAQRSRGFSA